MPEPATPDSTAGFEPDAYPGRGPRLLLRTAPALPEVPTWLDFRDPVRIVQAIEHSEVIPALEEIEAATTAGLYAAGFVTYEAASAFDPALTTRAAGPLPLAWFGLFAEARRHDGLPLLRHQPIPRLRWRPSTDLDAYRHAIASIRGSIERGDTYQANYTLRLRSAFDGDPRNFFAGLVTAQPVRYAAYVELPDHAICSASPELFFRLSGADIVSRPMKGTSRRGPTLAADRRLALALYDSPKNRAENLMIVDMVRNDLGRIALPGTVAVDDLFELETYESVHQLTSTVTARTTRSIVEIFAALFPCASITGAPKVRTMELLADLEAAPRGIYTGAIGYLGPDRQAQFNVAIRTVHVDRRRRLAEYGTGGGIVWDSSAEEEFRECAAKALVLGLTRPGFSLLETLRWDPGEGFFLLERHLSRLADSAAYFEYSFDREAVRETLLGSVGDDRRRSLRVRLLVQRSGEIRIEQEPMSEPASDGRRLAISPSPIDSDTVLLYHKTTAREVYDRARDSAPEYDDVLLWNGDGRLTESTVANLVFVLDGCLFTPPVEDGLLPGTLRQELVERGELSIRSLARRDLAAVEDLWLVNSVRGRIDVERIDEVGVDGPQTVWRNNRLSAP